MAVYVEKEGPVTTVVLSRPEVRNAVDRETAEFPQTCMREDRMSAYEQFDLSFKEALANEFRHGLNAIETEAVMGASRFAKGAGRHGNFRNI